jgi:DNA-binding NarL/FixJ family response regulator
MQDNRTYSLTGRPARIMIVDDHPIVREGLAALLAGYPDLTVSAQAEDIAGALRHIDNDPPDIAVIDISLKEESGLDLIRRIKERNKSVQMLAVSMHDENLFGERALAAGAMGYLNKQAASRKIVDAIRRVLSGKIYLSNELSDRLLTRKVIGSEPVQPNGVSLLTNRELEVFGLIGAGLTTAQIAARLHLSIKTIETHRQKIKSKLDLQNAAELSREAAQWVLISR